MFDRNLMKLEGMRAIMAGLVVLALLQALAIAGQAIFIASVVSDLWNGALPSDVTSGVGAFFACFSLLQLLRFAQETMLDRYSVDQAEALQRKLLDEAFDARIMLAQRTGAAVLATTVTDGIDEVQTYIRIIPPKIIGMAAISIPLLAVSFAFDWLSGVILAIMFPVIIFFMILLGKQAREHAERQYGAYTLLSNRFLDTLRGIGVIKAFSASHFEGEAVYRYSEKLRIATVRTLSTATLSSAVLDLCATFGVAAVAMMLAFRLMDGSIALSTALTVLVLAPEYFTPIRSFASDFHASLDGKNALSAVLEMLNAAKQVTEPSEEVSSPTPWDGSSTLELTRVSVEYDQGGSGIHNMSITFHGYERVALVGRSGTGKTTLTMLLAGLTEPSSGSILLDGKPIDLTQDTWRSQVRIIPQHPYIFRMSLADNIRFYQPDATDAQIEEAVRVVGLEELVSELPNGLATPVGEGSRGLSAGQAHRVALARIVLDRNARVLVFDEPTAHLDIETELELKRRMLPLMEGRLVLFATHMLHWLGDMDRVIDLDAESSAIHRETDEVLTREARA